jgi:hypothetical protein
MAMVDQRVCFQHSIFTKQVMILSVFLRSASITIGIVLTTIKRFKQCAKTIWIWTTWLEYFVKGLVTQLQEVQNCGQQVMKLDILAIQHNLSKRKREAIEQALEKGLSIKEF